MLENVPSTKVLFMISLRTLRAHTVAEVAHSSSEPTEARNHLGGSLAGENGSWSIEEVYGLFYDNVFFFFCAVFKKPRIGCKV